ncbi:CheR family methyltransferase [Cupriavidus pampae]|uniref:Protein-glutamate methylesterase/protein-glutamine glutaminase n=1 Tax=Cupriavidus pampae TaxID=659251 RepID=A0ABN7ZM19_9BURK|nr:CheR family methyltransferase [Cupriavidus pampae]CAG9186889.1 Protein-glutamate methylesterase/protein-glutamine glutaminase [Cupriavidus pampae]
MVRTPAAPITSHLNFPVVGIGASAGGIEVLKAFFEALPAGSGAAYVIVLHLAPDHASVLPDLLRHVTEMPVVQVNDTNPVEANHVYVISPSMVLTMVDGYLRVQPAQSHDDRRAAIDLFFRSLAEAHHERAISIVMSGAGSDGSVGLTRVKELGGITIAQQPDEAEFPSMPRAAINTGMVDLVLSAPEMPQRLMDLWINASRIQLPDTSEPDESHGGVAERTERVLRDILMILRTRTSHDFRPYKRATLLRRIERRLQVNGLTDLREYRDYLHEHPEETPQLLQDMLISVTNFFRDRDAFETLQAVVIPQLLQNRLVDAPIRVWSAGCATGEEAYSIAMVLQEAAERAGDNVQFQVFATDIDERAVATARLGLYPDSILADVDNVRARRFLTQDATHYRIQTELREHILFAIHNVLSDPPFSRLDMVCCRNLLIYLDRDAQIDILRTFHFALRPGGFLFLGGSETADAVGDLFTMVDKKARIYRANIAMGIDSATPVSHLGQSKTHMHMTVQQPADKRKFSFGDLHQRLVEQYAPPSVLLNRDSNIVHLSDRAGRFLQYAGGVPSHNIIAAVRPELRLELRTAIFQALQTNNSVEVRRVELTRDGRQYFVNMIARPVHDADSDTDFVLVLFDEVEDRTSAGSGISEAVSRDPIVNQLERELQRTKEQLQATIEQSETSTEESKASNEELQAINEELRSASEELETSKEELQSINEELTTVNAELKSTVEETSKINDDLQNLIAANDIGTIFVDRNIRIKRYTPRATEVFNIIPSDIGRSLLDITHRLEYDKLAADAADAFDSLRLIERELRSIDGRWYLARFLPYRTTEDRIDGAVLSFIEITSRRAAEEQVREGKRRMNIVAESTRDYAIITLDDEGRVTSWNRGAERIFGYAESEMLGNLADILFTPEDRERGVPEEEIAQARKYGRVEEDRWQLRKDGKRFRSSGVLSRLDTSGVIGFAKIARDLDEVLPASAPRADGGKWQHEQFRRDEFLANVSHELKHPLNLISVSNELIARLPESRENPTIERATNTIRRSIAGQAQLIDDLLDMSRIRTGKLSVVREKLDLRTVVRRACDAVLPDARARGLALACELADEPMWAHADLTRTEQVVWNLLSNAVKFTEEGGCIGVALSRNGAQIRLVVRNSGTGIDAQTLPYIFDLFRQGFSPGRRGGLGVGLSLVKELVTLQGGTVRAESAGLDQGATFTVELPCAPTHEIVDDAFAVPASTLQGMQVLIVDDDAPTVETFKLLLESEGATVGIAASGESALAQVESARPHLLLFDLDMSGMDGYELLRAIRGRPEFADIHAIALSGFRRQDDIDADVRAGFDAHLSKPITLNALLAVVARLQRQ